MKHKLLNKLWLRVGMIVAIMTTALAGTAWAEEVVYYTLDGTQTGGDNGYATESSITQNNITWMVTGNTTMSPWRIGGKNLTGENRPVYSTTAMGSAISKVELEVGSASSITVNSLKLIVASDASFATQIDEVSAGFTANSTITFTPTSGTEWSTGAYYKFVFNVTVSGTSNKFVEFKNAKFYYDNSGSNVKPIPTITVSSPVDALGNAMSTLYVNENFYVTVTTTSDAAITYTSNESELYVRTWNTETGKMCLIPHVDGQVSITYSVAETDNFAAAEKTETFTIVKTPTTCEIVVPDGFNNNIADGTNAGRLKGQIVGKTSYNSQSDNTTIASLFTWTSSNTDVATIANDGTVTLVAAGTTTITCNFAGDETYAASSKTYTLSVINGEYVQPTTVEANLNNSLFGTNYSGSVSISDENAPSGTIDNVTVTYGGSGNHYVNNSQIRFYPNNKLTFEAPEGYEIKSIVFTSAGTWTATISANGGSYDSSTKTWTGSETSVLFTGSGSGRCDMSKATITLGIPTIYSSIPDLFAAATTTPTTVTINFGNWVITGANSSHHAFLSDGTNGCMIYQEEHGFAEGNILSGTVQCKAQIYNGSLELTELTSTTESLDVNAGGIVTVANIAMADLAAINTGALVHYENLICSTEVSGSYTNYYLSDGTTTIQVYKTLFENYADYLEDGKAYNITGIYVLNNDTKRVNPRSATDIVECEVPQHTVSFSVNGIVTSSVEVSEAASITFPVNPTDIEGKTFVGWTTEAITGTTDIEPTMVTSATMGSEDVTYYAVFATQGSGSTGTYTLDYTEETDLQETTLGYGKSVTYTAVDGSTWVIKAYKNSGMQINVGKNSSIKVPTCPGSITSVTVRVSLAKAIGFSANDYTGSGEITYLAEGTAVQNQTLDLSNQNVTTGYIVPNGGSTSITKIVVNYSSVTYSAYCTTVTTPTPETEEIKITSLKYSTYASDNALDFTESGIKAFYATLNEDGSTLAFHQIDVVPAGTGVLLYSPSAITKDIPVFTGTPEEITENVFVRGTDEPVSYTETDYNYILFNGDNGIGFYKAKNNPVATNRAYIHIDSNSPVKYFTIDLDDDPTGIDNLNDNLNSNGAIYNLAGQRLQKMQKGINIINGKKVLK